MVKKAELVERIKELEQELEEVQELHREVARHAMENAFDDAMVNAYERKIQTYKVLAVMCILAMVTLVIGLLVIL